MEIILVIYINIGQKSNEEAEFYINKVKKNIENKTNKYTCFFIPVRSGDSRVECINPVFLDKKEYELKVRKTLIEYQLKLEEFLSTPITTKVKKNIKTQNSLENTPIKKSISNEEKVVKTTKNNIKKPK